LPPLLALVPQGSSHRLLRPADMVRASWPVTCTRIGVDGPGHARSAGAAHAV